jgi:tRNA dimethylallyltransferase
MPDLLRNRDSVAFSIRPGGLFPLVVVAGPTGAGKSDLAFHLAQLFDAEIVNADSLQLYRGMDIGTAKPPLAERGALPHHLFDFLEPTEVCTAGDYARMARAALDDIRLRGRLPVVVGGTGFYLRALIDGLFAGPPAAPELRARLQAMEAERSGRLWRLLQRLDAAAAARISVHDGQKIIRALEIRLLRGQSLDEAWAEGRDALTGFAPLWLGIAPTRSLLVERLAQRVERMFEAGLLEEVRTLLASGVPPDAKAFESVGYREAVAVLQGTLTLAQAKESTLIRTRQYAKRQMTWFRAQEGMQWLPGFGMESGVQQQAVQLLKDFSASL